MTTMTQDAPAVKPTAPTVARRRSVVAIAGHSYSIKPVGIAPEIGTVAYSVFRLDTAARYHVHVDALGVPHCDCPDATFRHEGNGTHCKHVLGLIGHGFIAPPPPPGGGIAGDGPDAEAPVPVALPGETPCADWPAWADESTWGLGPGPDTPLFDLAGWIRAQAGLYRVLDHGAADLVAATLEDLAGECELLRAARPDQVWDRRAAYGPRSDMPATGRAIDRPERSTALAGHPDRLEPPAQDMA